MSGQNLSNESQVTLFRVAVYCLDVASDYFVGILLLKKELILGGQDVTENEETATIATAITGDTTNGTTASTLGTTSTAAPEKNLADANHFYWGTFTIAFNHMTAVFGLYFMLKTWWQNRRPAQTSTTSKICAVLTCPIRLILWPLLIPLYM